MIQSVRINSNVENLYYQNDIESQHAVQKCIQEYKKRDAATVRKNLQRLSDKQDVEEVRALYGAGNYSITRPYKRIYIDFSLIATKVMQIPINNKLQVSKKHP